MRLFSPYRTTPQTGHIERSYITAQCAIAQKTIATAPLPLIFQLAMPVARATTLHNAGIKLFQCRC
jgi:hypothetical protein